MTQGKHTPGSWVVAFEEGTKVKDAGKNTVAWLQQTHLRGKRSEEEVAANARLIAAAPDLLEALKIMEKAESLSEIAEALRVGRSAIAKAEGLS